MPSEGELQAAARAIARDIYVTAAAARRLAYVALEAAERIRNIEHKSTPCRRRANEEA